MTPKGISARRAISYFSLLQGNAHSVPCAQPSVNVQHIIHRIFFLTLFLSASALHAQVDEGGSVPDSVARVSAASVTDSATGTSAAGLLDSVQVRGDSVLVFPRKDAVDTIITYKARDSVVYQLDQKLMDMHGESRIVYGSTGIASEMIRINWDNSTIVAQGVRDSSGALSGTPQFTEGAETYNGEEMTYNFKTKRGVITKGETAIDDGFYLGERIKRTEQNHYFIQHGQYTTCDDPTHKHYYFGAGQMKVIPDDVVVARPITLYVEDIPLLWLPFAVIPSSKGGRSSGIIIPSFGDDAARGRFLVGGGYYLAASDYWDVALTGDIYTKGGYQLSANVNYALRYNFTGSVQASYGRTRRYVGDVFRADDEPATDWSLNVTHNQEIDPTSRLSANVNLATKSYYDNFSNNIDELLNQSLRSSASYSKSWEGTNRSIAVGFQRSEQLVEGTSEMTLPDVSFNQSQVYPFRGDDGATDDWYDLIGFNYRGQFLNRMETKNYTVERDTLRDTFHRRGIDHSVSLIATPKLGYVTISPSFSYRERWYDHRVERSFTPGDSLVRGSDATGFYALRTFNASLSLSSKIYGMFQPNVFGVQAIRHTVQPTISYQWYPDFSKESWGYYQSYVDSTGKPVRYDPYSSFDYRPGTVFGGVSQGESQSLNFSVNNIFEMKLNPRADDTTQTPRKMQLFTLGADAGYNMAADSMKLSDVRLSFRTSIQELLDIYGNATLSPYVFERNRLEAQPDGSTRTVFGRKVNRFLVNEGQGLARLTQFNINLSTSLSSKMFETSSPVSTDSTNPALREVYSFRIPWTLTLGYDYSITSENPDNIFRNSGLRASLTFSFTPSWHVSMNGYYDIVNKEIGAPFINVRKDLHCWEMNFDWWPAGPYRRFMFVLRLKAPQLQDIKLEREGSDRGVFSR